MVHLLVVLKNVMSLLSACFAVLCLPIIKSGRTAGARARGLRGHLETVVLGSDAGGGNPSSRAGLSVSSNSTGRLQWTAHCTFPPPCMSSDLQPAGAALGLQSSRCRDGKFEELICKGLRSVLSVF